MSDAELRKLISTAPGRVYSISTSCRSRRDRAGVSRPRVRERRRHAAADVRENDTRADVRFTVVEGPQIIVDHVIIAGNRRISARRSSAKLRPAGEPLGEAGGRQSRAQSQSLGCSGACRSRRSRTPARPVATSWSGRRVAGRRRDLPGRRRGGYFVRPTAEGGLPRIGSKATPRGSIPGHAAESVGQEPHDHVVHACQPAYAGSADDRCRAGAAADSKQLRVPRISRARVYREPRSVRRRRDADNRHCRASVPTSFNFARKVVQAQIGNRLSDLYTVTGAYQFQRTRLFDIRAPEDDEAWLIDRLFPQVRLEVLSARSSGQPRSHRSARSRTGTQ